ncbi:DNA injection protein [Caudoviricetes sp.]|nr:DNA injection protein [Caudoviricetes sp.]
MCGGGNILDKAASAATGGAIGGKQGSRDVWGTSINQDTPLGSLASPIAKGALLAGGAYLAAPYLAGGAGAGTTGMAAMPGETALMAPTGGIAHAGTVASAQAAGLGLGAGVGAGAGVLGTGLTAGQAALGLGGIGATLYGVQQNKKAAEDAAKIQAAATQGSTALQAEMFRQSQENQRPWLEAGGRALTQQERLVTDPSSYQQDPYNAWLQEQGLKGLERSASARGMTLSGNALKSLTKYNQGMAGQGFADQYNRWASLSGTGQTQANQMAGQAGQYASNVGNLNMQNAANQANLGMARAGANNQLVQGVLGNAASMYGMYNQNQQNNMLMNLLNRPYRPYGE